MPPLLLPAGTPISVRPDVDPDWQVSDCWYACIPGSYSLMEERFRQVVEDTPLHTLKAAVDAGEVTRGQWILFTAATFVGQVDNGGVVQFVGNFPGLVRDAALVLGELGPPALCDAYVAYAALLLAVLEAHSDKAGRHRNDLDEFWTDFETADGALDDALAAVIDRHAHYKRYEEDGNWMTALEVRIVEETLAHPDDFRERT